MEKNGSAVGAALINEFKQTVADGRLPQVDMSQFKNAEELAAYLVNAIRSAPRSHQEGGCLYGNPQGRRAG